MAERIAPAQPVEHQIADRRAVGRAGETVVSSPVLQRLGCRLMALQHGLKDIDTALDHAKADESPVTPADTDAVARVAGLA